jgi:hypothetical protein
MTHQEAVDESERLRREHPDRHAANWLPRRLDSGGWTVVRVPAARPRGRRDLRGEVAPPPPRPDPSQDVPRVPYPLWPIA